MIVRSFAFALGLGCVAAAGCSNNNTPMFRYSGDGPSYAEGTGGHSGYLAPGDMRIRRKVCDGVDILPDYRHLDENALIDFLAARKLTSEQIRERPDLVYLRVRGPGIDDKDGILLRVAILKGIPEAGKELHEALLQHGPGSWGVHRANLAVLGPIGTANDVITFASASQLACWGVLTMAGRDDDFVVAGGYTEL